MTTEVIQSSPAEEAEESFYLPQMCDGRKWEEQTCDNKAEYRLRTICCGAIVWWCEDCMFAWFEFCDWMNSDGHSHYRKCSYCQEQVVLDKDFVKVIGRIN